MAIATFRFYEELNRFLAPERRKQAFDCRCAPAATVGQMIAALGVPHAEVELVLVNGESVGFDRLLRDGDRVAVYPMCEALDISPLLRVRQRPLRVTRFVAAAPLRRLTHLLRLAGFDTLYGGDCNGSELAALALREHRIILTCESELLKRRDITHGCHVQAARPARQLREIFERLALANSARPFSLCPRCNAPLHAMPGHDQRLGFCAICHQVFGTEVQRRRMQALLKGILAPP